jgi:hypothetical protein
VGFIRSRIEKKARETTEEAVKRAEGSDNPIERTLGPDGVAQVQEMMSSLEKFGVHLDAESALGLSPASAAAVAGPGAPTPGSAAPQAPTPAAPATPAPSSPGDPIGEIERLAGLHASGALTDDEFAAAKKSVVDG